MPMEAKTKRLKIGLYNPYFDSFGGGERYMLTLGEYWSKRHDVSVFWDDNTIIATSQKRFKLDLSRVNGCSECIYERVVNQKNAGIGYL